MPCLFFHVVKQGRSLKSVATDLLFVILKTVVHLPNLQIIAAVGEETASVVVDLQPRQTTSKAVYLNICPLALHSG